MKKEINNWKEFLNENTDFWTRIGGTKKQEYKRTVELFEQIYKEKGLYFALALLYDSQYENKDILGMMEILKPGKGKISDMLKKEK